MADSNTDHTTTDGNETANGICGVIKPVVQRIDNQVEAVRKSQLELRVKIEEVSSDLQRISEEQPVNVNFDPYIRRLINSKRRVTLINNIIQNVHDRLERLQRNAEQETNRVKTIVQAESALINVTQGVTGDPS
uniref:Biogenesis of lysosome-related organelles complex 1 subunit 7 n=1 Tax=Ciona intestinalis TaxID=7719 RepID=H2Y1M8_CIOIN|nr:SNARE-associated protein Snapin-like [Ciona intestinalis]|eukprot:XP_002124048.1 SNARE-associated protein Snapin-like [Ciona intestinalis]